MAISNWPVLAPLGMWRAATLCRPDSWNEKTGLKLTSIEAPKNAKKGFDRSVDSAVELGLGFCFQQNV